MSSKYNYFTCKEQHNNSTNHFTKYLKIAKYISFFFNVAALLVFANETVKVLQ